uniref:AAA domain-containing protein n=1 Tax=Strongyloides papillosus TaxID=174720 RepID=A0A0N5BT92_STREA
MNFCGRAASILRRIFKGQRFCSPYNTKFITCSEWGDEKKISSGVEGINSGRASTKPYVGLSQSFNKKKKTTKPQNTNLNWNELKDKLSKMPNHKKEAYMEDMIRDILSKNPNILEDKLEKKRYSTITKVIRSIFFAYRIYSRIKTLQDELEIRPTSFSGLLNFLGSWTSENTVLFDDFQAMDEVRVGILTKIFKYLSGPKKYVRPGRKLRKSVSLFCSPETCKTLLDRAIACEAHILFFYKSGSELNETSPGQGVEKIKELFKTAKSNTPCFIFIYEIDSIGSNGGLNCLRLPTKQFINKLLTKMDGFDNSEGIIVIGATNRLEDLDKALLRTGRFDIHINCSIPDLSGRIEIFKHYLDKVPHKNVDIDVLAKTTIGFSAADTSNVINQAALKAATEGCHYVMQKHLEEASDRVVLGPARIRAKLPDKESNRITAYHETGHILATSHTSYATPLNKERVLPRQKSLGHASIMKEYHHTTDAEILAEIDDIPGGRVAEGVISDKGLITRNGYNELEGDTLSNKGFIKKFGMSEDIGLRTYESNISQKPDANNGIHQTTGKYDFDKYIKQINEIYKKINENNEKINENNKIINENNKIINENRKLIDENGKIINKNRKIINENNKIIGENNKKIDESKEKIKRPILDHKKWKKKFER